MAWFFAGLSFGFSVGLYCGVKSSNEVCLRIKRDGYRRGVQETRLAYHEIALDVKFPADLEPSKN